MLNAIFIEMPDQCFSIFTYTYNIYKLNGPALSWTDPIGGVIVIVLASGAAHRGFEPRSDQTKDYKQKEQRLAGWDSGLCV